MISFKKYRPASRKVVDDTVGNMPGIGNHSDFIAARSQRVSKRICRVVRDPERIYPDAAYIKSAVLKVNLLELY